MKKQELQLTRRGFMVNTALTSGAMALAAFSTLDTFAAMSGERPGSPSELDARSARAEPGQAEGATGRVGLFEAESDVGNPAIAGSTIFVPATKEYRITGAGANIWAKRDEFHFVWVKLSGDISLSATIHFSGVGTVLDRKAGVMIRKSLEPGSTYVDAVVHGGGLTALQVRDVTDDITRGFRLPVVSPPRIKLERKGNSYSIFQGREGEPLQEAGSVQVSIGSDPMYAGLFVCSHSVTGSETATFSDVILENSPAAPTPAHKKKVEPPTTK